MQDVARGLAAATSHALSAPVRAGLIGVCL
jgi:hypothetical protein